MTSLAGIKFTEMEPLYGDQYGQIAVLVSTRPRRACAGWTISSRKCASR